MMGNLIQEQRSIPHHHSKQCWPKFQWNIWSSPSVMMHFWDNIPCSPPKWGSTFCWASIVNQLMWVLVCLTRWALSEPICASQRNWQSTLVSNSNHKVRKRRETVTTVLILLRSNELNSSMRKMSLRNLTWKSFVAVWIIRTRHLSVPKRGFNGIDFALASDILCTTNDVIHWTNSKTVASHRIWIIDP